MDIEPYLNELKAKKLSQASIRNYKRVLIPLDKFKAIEKIEKPDLIAFFNQLDYAESTIMLFQAIVKKYFTDIGKPELVSWIEFKKPKETLKSDDILTPEDITAMIEATESHYFKALIAFLFETGCRISEAMAIHYRDLHDTDHGMIVHVPTSKTGAGFRKVILPLSGQYLKNLKAYSNAKKEDLVFDLSYPRTHAVLLEIAKDAGIEKPVSPHKFRHSQATDLVRRGYNEAIIRKKLGWSATSPMIARYQHLNDEDVINATLENSGRLPQTASPRTEIKEAERLSIVDAAMQFSKLSEENESLKARLDSLEAERKEQNEFILNTLKKSGLI